MEGATQEPPKARCFIFVLLNIRGGHKTALLFLSERVTEAGVHRVIHVVLTKCRFLKLQTKAEIIANFCIQTNIHEHTSVFLAFDAFFTRGIARNGFTVCQNVKLVTEAGTGSDFPVLTRDGFTDIDTGTANQRVEVLSGVRTLSKSSAAPLPSYITGADMYYPGELSLSMSDRLLIMETTCSDNVHAVLQVELRR